MMFIINSNTKDHIFHYRTSQSLNMLISKFTWPGIPLLPLRTLLSLSYSKEILRQAMNKCKNKQCRSYAQENQHKDLTGKREIYLYTNVSSFRIYSIYVCKLIPKFKNPVYKTEWRIFASLRFFLLVNYFKLFK